MPRPELSLPARDAPRAGAAWRWLLVASRAGTAVLFVSTGLGVAWTEQAGRGAQVVALALFAAGCGAFLRAFATGVRRSRFEQVSTLAAFLKTPGAPRAVRIELQLAAGLQFAAGLTGAALRPFGPLAFGILAGVYGLGLIALWGARHGEFPDRSLPVERRRNG